MHSQLFTCCFFINVEANQIYINMIILILKQHFDHNFDK